MLSRRLLSTAVLSSSLLPAASSMRVLLIRHAQSQNNVIAREERSVPGRSRKEARAAFEKRRYEDPMLSELGSAQAESLGEWLATDPLLAPFADERVDVLCSPMQRTMLTARPLLKAFPSWRGHVDERLYETGGIFTTDEHGVDTAGTGMTAAQLRDRFPEFEPSEHIVHRGELGWYHLDHRETRAEMAERMGRVAAWLGERARAADAPPLLVLVVHGDFLDELLKLLLGSKGRFMHYNTAQTYLELEAAPRGDEGLGRATMYFVNRAEHVGSAARTGEEMIQVVA